MNVKCEVEVLRDNGYGKLSSSKKEAEVFILETKKYHLLFGLFGLVGLMPSIGRKVGIPRGILPHVQTGLTNWKSR